MPLSQKTIQFRRDSNLCERCGQPNVPDRKMCQKHLDQVAVRQNKQRAKKKRLGICERCKNPVIPDEILCVECKPKVAQANCIRNKKRYKKRKAQFICMTCDDPVESGKTQCRPCLDGKALIQKDKREEFESNNQCSICGKDLSVDSEGKRCDTCIEKWKSWYVESDYKERLASMRDENFQKVLDHYGTKCVCCGQDDPIFLTVDHIDGDGEKHRKEIKKWGSGFYKWLIDQNFPCGFQILCYNCNMGRHRNGGICPHKSDN